jgi:CheY-like chemotaxis protein
MHFWKKGNELAEGSTPPSARGTILVVDDEPVMRAITGAVLNALGWNVLNAGSGEEAVRMTRFVQERGSRLDMVILDLILPCGMSGFEAAQAVHHIQPGVRILACSGFFDDDGKSCLALGFNATLAKPFTADDLAQSVYQCLHGPEDKSAQQSALAAVA